MKHFSESLKLQPEELELAVAAPASAERFAAAPSRSSAIGAAWPCRIHGRSIRKDITTASVAVNKALPRGKARQKIMAPPNISDQLNPRFISFRTVGSGYLLPTRSV